MFEVMIALAILAAVLAGLILPWINRNRIQKMRQELAQLRQQVAKLEAGAGRPAETEAAPADEPEEITGIHWELPQQDPVEPQTPAWNAAGPPEGAGTVSDQNPEAAFSFRHTAQSEPASAGDRKSEGFELQFGGRIFVWFGAVALALAGFFLVKYSIEAGLLSPAVRVVMGSIFGIALIFTGSKVRTKEGFANGVRIAQALSGSGIAILYASFYAATGIYDLIPVYAGFAGMAAVTATAVVLSLWHGLPHAILGMMGGFLTPALLRSPHPQASILFLYLFLVLAGLMAIIRYRKWWSLSLPAVGAAFAWVPIWVFSGHFSQADTLCIGLFLIASAAVAVICSKEQYERDLPDPTARLGTIPVLNYLATCGALVLTAFAAVEGGPGAKEWLLFGVMTLGGLWLAHYRERLYFPVPWVSAAASAAMLAEWDFGAPQVFAFVLAIFAVVHILGAYYLQTRKTFPLNWAGLTAASSLGYYLLGYNMLLSTRAFSGIPLFWGLLALSLAAFAFYLLMDTLRRFPTDHPRKQHLLAVYSGVVAAFVSIGLTVELKREFLSVAIAAELAAVAWIDTKVDIRALRRIAALLGCVFGFLLIPQILLVLQLTSFSLVEAELHLQESIPIVKWPIFQLGLPALCFLGGSYLLRGEKDDRLVFSLEAAAVGLIGLMGYYLTRHIFHIGQDVLFVKAGFIERGVVTNIFFVYGLCCLWSGRKWDRAAVSLGGMIVTGVALFRIVYFDLFIHNPLWSAQNVGSIPILNGLLVTYGLPLLWIWLTMKERPRLGAVEWSRYGYGFMLLLAFVCITLNVRQLFQGPFLNGPSAQNAEIYAYSAVWLVFGIALLFLGTLRRDKMIRVASLPVILLTMAKVFLYDASTLTGLWRAFSFFCLGLCLIGISWFYTRFVFNVKGR